MRGGGELRLRCEGECLVEWWRAGGPWRTAEVEMVGFWFDPVVERTHVVA